MLVWWGIGLLLFFVKKNQWYNCKLRGMSYAERFRTWRGCWWMSSRGMWLNQKWANYSTIGFWASAAPRWWQGGVIEQRHAAAVGQNFASFPGTAHLQRITQVDRSFNNWQSIHTDAHTHWPVAIFRFAISFRLQTFSAGSLHYCH